MTCNYRVFTVTQRKPLSSKLMSVFSLPQLFTITVEKHSSGYHICCNPDSGTCVVSLLVHTYYLIVGCLQPRPTHLLVDHTFSNIMGRNLRKIFASKNTYKKCVVAYYRICSVTTHFTPQLRSPRVSG